jgi:uroporphyrinogen-III synthase
MSLIGKTVVVTRGIKSSSEWTKKLIDIGANVYNLPTISTSLVELDETLINILKSLTQFDWLVFTSAAGIKYFSILRRRFPLNQSHNKLPAVAVIGDRTEEAVLESGLKVTFKPTKSDNQHLAQELPLKNNQRVLLLRTTIASNHLAIALQSRGAFVSDARIYQTNVLTLTDSTFSELLRANSVDFITFASPSAVVGFTKRLGSFELEKAKHLPAVAIGPSVAKKLTHMHFLHVHIADNPSIDGIILKLQQLAK